MRDRFSLEDLARFTTEPIGRLRDLASRGLLGSGSASFTAEDIEKVRTVQILLRQGISVDQIEAATREDAKGGLMPDYNREIFPGGVGPVFTLAEAAEYAGLNPDRIRRLWDAAGMHDQTGVLYQEDVEMLRHLQTALAAGFPEEALIQLVRVYADALGRVAEVETRLFRFYIQEQVPGDQPQEEYLATLESIGDQLNPLIEPAVLYFHRKGLIRGIREQVAWHIEQIIRGGRKPGAAPGQMRAAIAFIDLASFTPLAEAMGDAAAAGVLERFGDIIRQSVGAWGGRVVKQIGDEFMLVFPEPTSALAAALEIDAHARGESHFPAVRGGIQWGSVLYREGDYVGSNVNIASRLAAAADRHQVLITADVRREVAGMPDVEFVRIGKRRLKGLTGEVDLFEARPCVIADPERVTDPVCGMELTLAEVAATLALDGRERAFCSEECLRRFVASPSEYTG